MRRMAPSRLLKNSCIGAFSTSLTGEVAIKKKMDKPQPQRKYIQGLPLPPPGSELSFFHPRERQKGESRRTASVTYKNKMISANQRTFVPTMSLGSDSNRCLSCFCERCPFAEK